VARRGLKQSRRETASASHERDALIDERETARAHAAAQPADGTNQPSNGTNEPGHGTHEPDPSRPGGHDPSLREDTRWGWLPHLVKPRTASDRPAAGSPAPDTAADSHAAADSPSAAESPAIGSRP
jgi:hypothetical protein